MRRPFDIVFVRGLVKAHTISASEVATAYNDLGPPGFATARDVLGVLDLGAVTGSIVFAGVDGSDDGIANTLNISAPAFAAGAANTAQYFNLPKFRRYRFAATTIVTGPIIYGFYLIGLAATTPVTQAL